MYKTALSYLFLGVAVTMVVATALSSYDHLRALGATPKVTWLDASGNAISSITLTFSSPGTASQTVMYTCSSPTGEVSLKLSSGKLSSVVTLSQISFPSCTASPNIVTVTATSSLRISTDGSLQVRETPSAPTYGLGRTLASPLSVSVRVS